LGLCPLDPDPLDLRKILGDELKTIRMHDTIKDAEVILSK